MPRPTAARGGLDGSRDHARRSARNLEHERRGQEGSLAGMTPELVGIQCDRLGLALAAIDDAGNLPLLPGPESMALACALARLRAQFLYLAHGGFLRNLSRSPLGPGKPGYLPEASGQGNPGLRLFDTPRAARGITANLTAIISDLRPNVSQRNETLPAPADATS